MSAEQGASGAAGPASLDRLDADRAMTELLRCCASSRWAARVAAGRPYGTAPALFDAAERAWWSLDAADWLQAFAAHPRIGERERADPGTREEQAGVAGVSPVTLAALAEGNRRYEERFGHVFLVCASGMDAGRLLAELERRLEGEPGSELRVAAAEQAKITRLRLAGLLERLERAERARQAGTEDG